MTLKDFFSVRPFVLCLFLMCITCNEAPKENDKKIDFLLYKARMEMGKLDYEKTIRYAQKAEGLALENNKDKLADVYLEMADALAGLEYQKESLTYLDKIMKTDFDKKGIIFKVRVYHIYAYNYMELGIGSQSVNYNKKAIAVLSSAKTDQELGLLARSYGELSYYNYSTQNTDSAFHYFDKWEKVLRRQQEKDALFDITSLYNLKGFLFLEQKKQVDSALFYFKKGYDLKVKYKDPIRDGEYIGLGASHFFAGDFQKALNYYLKAEQNVKEQNIKTNENNNINKLLAETYEALDQPEKHSYYLKKYTTYNDSLKTVRITNVDVAVKVLMKRQTDETSTVKRNFTLLLSVISFVILTVGILIYLYFKRKSNSALKTKELLQEKENIISQKEEETQELKLLVNESFDDVIQLAKDNSLEFFTRFEEVYPEFIKNLLQIDGKLRVTELTLCAYFFLGFTTKDIARYTFKSVNTVRNRRQNLRNKLRIPTDTELELWFKNLHK